MCQDTEKGTNNRVQPNIPAFRAGMWLFMALCTYELSTRLYVQFDTVAEPECMCSTAPVLYTVDELNIRFDSGFTRKLAGDVTVIR